ncbi:MAG: heme exporter protein CcmD [Geminicoccaceae bacterium]
MGEFFAMGGYGAFVWAAYGVTFLGLALLFVWSWLGARSRDAELEQVRHWARAEKKEPGSATLRPADNAERNEDRQGRGATDFQATASSGHASGHASEPSR